MSTVPKGPASKGNEILDLENSLVHSQRQTQVAEEKFRLLIESVTDYGIFILSPEGVVESWNSGAERIKGYTADEIIGKHFSTFYTAFDIERDHPQKELILALEHGRYEEEGYRVRKDGTTFWANVVITPLKDNAGTLVGYAKVTRDLTSRKKAEDELRNNEERARKMFEGVKDYAMIMLEPDGKIATWNEGARRIKGYKPEEIIGKHFSVFYPEHDVSMGKCQYELKEAAETGKFEEEGWRIRKDGTRFWGNVLITAIRDESRNLIGFSKVTRDITDRKRADDLLKMAQLNLEKRVEERTEELRIRNDQLREAVAVRDEFLSIASHELRTPLTPLKLQIQSLISMLKKNIAEPMKEDRIERFASICNKSLSRLSNLVENLLDVSRINSGKFVLNRESVDMTELSQELLERYHKEISDSGSSVSLQSEGLIVGQLDRLRVEQVLANLLMNALKYGQGHPISIKLFMDGAEAKMEFKDHGVGIPIEDQKRIFDRYERVDATDNIGGLGLGLYITRQIVEAHGGKISVESAQGTPTVFTLRLPLDEGAEI